METLEKIRQFIGRFFIRIAGWFLLAMILLSCANIFLRIVWKPIPGTFELMGFFGALATALALAYTQMMRGHISVDILVNMFSQRMRKRINVFNNIIFMCFFAIVAWHMGKYSNTAWKSGEVTETLHIIYYPFTYCIALGCTVLAFVFLVEILKFIFNAEEVKE